MLKKATFVALICGVITLETMIPADAQSFPVYGNSGRIGVIDQEELFAKSNAGLAILEAYQNSAKELSQENKTIQNQLEQEERDLTETRKTMDSAAFNVLASEFDAKVKKIRAEQANKERVLNLTLNQNRASFFEKLTPILQAFIEENGIEIVLNKDTVVLALSGRDITEPAIQRINEMLKEQ